MLVFRADPPDQQGIHCPAKPRGAKAERFDAREQQTQSRVKGDGHAGGDEHGQSLRVGSGLNIRPSCASRVNTGRKEMAMTSKAKNVGAATSFTAERITVR